MPTTGIQVHDKRYITIDTVQFDHITDWSFSINGENIDVSSYDSSGWKELIAGMKSWNFSCTAHYAGDATEGGDEAAADIIAGTTIAFLSTTGVSGDVTFGGNALLNTFDMSGSMGAANSVSIQGDGTGALAIGAVA
ncbi:MAG: phage tail tube protein [Lewinella sp.]|uniref:phage tail tube protein n=1 Tax=Lewinella sp. TaxID=2004506 RepID=UPI003D6B1E01